MTRCECPVDRHWLLTTNEVWNIWGLNAPWSVGLVSNLIRQGDFQSYEEWKNHYYWSGEMRSQIIKTMPAAIQHLLMYCSQDQFKIYFGSDISVRQIVRYFGRTRQELKDKAGLLRHASWIYSGVKLNAKTAFDLVEYRVLGETWNGIYLRERNTMQKLKKTFSDIDFRPVSGHWDYIYGIDYIVYRDQKMLCAVQIKPLSYDCDRRYINKAKMANSKKNLKFEKEYGIPVITLLSDESGDIKSQKTIAALSLL